MNALPSRVQHVAALDSIRCLAALWVCFGHGLAPPLWRGVEPSGWEAYAAALWGNLFPGQAAVIVFFVISGFCIHWPVAQGIRLVAGPFLVRRLVRVGLPIAVLAAAAELSLGRSDLLATAIYWSIYCELLYYLAYPLLLRLLAAWGWRRLLAAAWLAAAAVAATQPDAPIYPSFGVVGTAVLGLPCWLLGAWLADTWQPPATPRPPPWAWRAATLAAMTLASVLHFHAGLSYVWTLNLFALLATRWIRAEIDRFRHARVRPLLERAGQASYSLYLVHLPVLTLVYGAAPGLGAWQGWALQWAAVLAACAAFHLLVERPAHRLGRLLARRRLVSSRPADHEA